MIQTAPASAMPRAPSAGDAVEVPAALEQPGRPAPISPRDRPEQRGAASRSRWCSSAASPFAELQQLLQPQYGASRRWPGWAIPTAAWRASATPGMPAPAAARADEKADDDQVPPRSGRAVRPADDVPRSRNRIPAIKNVERRLHELSPRLRRERSLRGGRAGRRRRRKMSCRAQAGNADPTGDQQHNDLVPTQAAAALGFPRCVETLDPLAQARQAATEQSIKTLSSKTTAIGLPGTPVGCKPGGDLFLLRRQRTDRTWLGGMIARTPGQDDATCWTRRAAITRFSPRTRRNKERALGLWERPPVPPSRLALCSRIGSNALTHEYRAFPRSLKAQQPNYPFDASANWQYSQQPSAYGTVRRLSPRRRWSNRRR